MKGQAVARSEKADRSDRVMAINPLDEPVLEHFYKPLGSMPRNDQRNDARSDHRSDHRSESVPARAKPTHDKPTHYKIVCISLYTDDIERLESMVAKLKSRGHTKANKSQLIRAALDQVDLEKVPKGY